MTEKATVIDIQERMITLGCSTGTCGNCSAGGMCNIKERVIHALNSDDLPLEKGDLVTIYLPPGKTVFSAFMVMILPLLLFIAGYQIADRLAGIEREGLKILCGVAGLAAGFASSWGYGKLLGKSQYPTIIGVEKP